MARREVQGQKVTQGPCDLHLQHNGGLKTWAKEDPSKEVLF